MYPAMKHTHLVASYVYFGYFNEAKTKVEYLIIFICSKITWWLSTLAICIFKHEYQKYNRMFLK